VNARAAREVATQGLQRLLAPLPESQFSATGRKPAALIDEVAASGLTGRGGACFPTALKLRAVASARGPAVVVANGAEGEPLSTKDENLLLHNPHLVIAGAVAAAVAVGANDVIVAVGARSPAAIARAGAAIDAWHRARGPRLYCAVVPDGFVAGEETALVHFLNGGTPTPTFVPPRPSERGVHGRPTLVQNVESLANVALIDQHGADWFRELGTSSEPGTALVTVSGAVRRPGVREVELGTQLHEALALAGGPVSPPSAILVGGYFGTWLDARDLDIPLSNAGLRPAGASLGARVLRFLDTTSCGLIETARILAYLARESAGQCGPCKFGLRALAADADSLACGAVDPTTLQRLHRLAGLVEGRGACAHPDGASRLLRSALRVFAPEVELHLRNRCSRGEAR
jgi:NADH:ubiquinone oxidoreductase subunit F (NADH-binding)